MSSKTKIVVLRMKEIVYTAIFLGLGLLLILLLLIMFRAGRKAPAASGRAVYRPGVYTSALTLGSQQADITVTVDAERITSVSMVPLTDAVETMYPLVAPSLENLSGQICETQSLENLTWPDGMRYTSQALTEAIRQALDRALISGL